MTKGRPGEEKVLSEWASLGQGSALGTNPCLSLFGSAKRCRPNDKDMVKDKEENGMMGNKYPNGSFDFLRGRNKKKERDMIETTTKKQKKWY